MTWDCELSECVKTPIGIYPAGTPVLVVHEHRHTVRICLDWPRGVHPVGRCHSVTVRREWLDQPRQEPLAVMV